MNVTAIHAPTVTARASANASALGVVARALPTQIKE